ncbi:bacteriophage HK97-gp10 putative tail-component [Paracoccus lutimaris]|uniref:Bacteriophage HK97-gp10 putative tail-component n=1 Tax=Paracoccus lutimaris TaxID=1490030 RepID=A0A368YXD0_9RHOB|nr:bacteriophage HK97-gp10 putative tail-component [Paracoccus lutimaris]
MSITKQSSDALAKRLAAIAPEIKAKVAPAVLKSAEEVADKARQLAEASRRTGETIDSIAVTGPGETTPPYAQGGATAQAHELQALVTVGNANVHTAHLVEFGTEERHHKDGTSTGKVTPLPFMLPAWRLAKTRVERRVNRAAREGVKPGHDGRDARRTFDVQQVRGWMIAQPLVLTIFLPLVELQRHLGEIARDHVAARKHCRMSLRHRRRYARKRLHPALPAPTTLDDPATRLRGAGRAIITSDRRRNVRFHPVGRRRSGKDSSDDAHAVSISRALRLPSAVSARPTAMIAATAGSIRPRDRALLGLMFSDASSSRWTLPIAQPRRHGSHRNGTCGADSPAVCHASPPRGSPQGSWENWLASDQAS